MSDGQRRGVIIINFFPTAVGCVKNRSLRTCQLFTLAFATGVYVRARARVLDYIVAEPLPNSNIILQSVVKLRKGGGERRMTLRTPSQTARQR